MFKWLNKLIGKRADVNSSSDAIYLSKMREEDIMKLHYCRGSVKIIYDFENLNFFKIKYLAKKIYPLIKDSIDPSLDQLARTIYSLTMLPIGLVQEYFNGKSIYWPHCNYIATIEPGNEAESIFKIYPCSIQCLPCLVKQYRMGIVPIRKMTIEEAHQIIVQCQSIDEFNQHFNFYLTHPNAKCNANWQARDDVKENIIIDMILSKYNPNPLAQFEKYIAERNLDIKHIKMWVEYELFKRLRNGIDEGKWEILFDIQLLYHSHFNLVKIFASPQDIKNIFKSMCGGGIYEKSS
jgi:hypothetical protein